MKSHGFLPLLLAGLVSLSACGGPPPGGFPPPKVKTMTLSEEPVAETTQYLAYLTDRQSAEIKPSAEGHITHIYVTPGQYVQKGTPLLHIDSRAQTATTQSLQATAAASSADYQQNLNQIKALEAQKSSVQAQYDLAAAQLARVNQVTDPDALSKTERDQAQQQADSAKAALDQSTSQLNAQRANAERSRQNISVFGQQAQAQKVLLGFHTVTAPASGYVGDIPVKVGDRITRDTIVTSVTQNKRLEVNIQVAAEAAHKLYNGMTVLIEDTDGNAIGKSQVFSIAPRVDAKSQTILVKAWLDNAKGLLRSEQLLRARLVAKSHPGIKLPVLAVSHNGGLDFVYVPKEAGKKSPTGYVADMIPVKVGEIQGQYYLVQSGLKAGQTIISEGIQSLFPGAPIDLGQAKQ